MNRLERNRLTACARNVCGDLARVDPAVLDEPPVGLVAAADGSCDVQARAAGLECGFVVNRRAEGIGRERDAEPRPPEVYTSTEEPEEAFTGDATIEDLLSKFGSGGKRERKRRQDDQDEETNDDRYTRRQRDASCPADHTARTRRRSARCRAVEGEPQGW